MFDIFSRLSSVTLHVSLGLILAVEGALSLFHAVTERHDPHLLVFAAVEGIAALLVAAVVHLLRGEFPSEHLVYAVAVLFVLIHGSGSRSPRAPAAVQ